MSKYDFQKDMKAYNQREQAKKIAFVIVLLLVAVYFVKQALHGQVYGENSHEAAREANERPNSYYKPSGDNYEMRRADGTAVKLSSQVHQKPADPSTVYSTSGKVVERSRGKIGVRTDRGTVMTFDEPSACPELGTQVVVEYSGIPGRWVLESIRSR